MSIDDEIVEDFIIESEENLETLDSCLMAIESGEPPDVDAIFRAMHSVKSAAGFLEIVSLEKIAHSAETSLSFVRDYGRVLQREDVDILIESTGMAREILESFKEGQVFDESQISDLLVRLKEMEQRMETGEGSTSSEYADLSHEEDVQNESASVEADIEPAKEEEPASVEPVGEVEVVPEIPQIKSRPVRKTLSAPVPFDEGSVSESKPTLQPNLDESEMFAERLTPPKKLGAPTAKKLDAPMTKLDAPPTKLVSPGAPIEVTESTTKPTTPEMQSLDVDRAVANVSEKSKTPKESPPSTPKIKARPVRQAQSNEANDTAVHDGQKSESKVNVSTELLDEIINLVGELVVARNQIIRYVEENGLETIKRMVLPISHLTTDIQEKVMKTRMRQIGSAWGRYPRMIRDLGRDINKNVELKMVGQETELDRSLLTMLQEPMRHMLRNAVDHGLEETEDRIAAGKSPVGTVWLKAYQSSGQVVIEISDDGRGLDPEKIAAKAIKQGIISEQRAESMSVEEIQKLVFAPGFSTKEAVTNISGRGVGMDVVNTMVSKVSGVIEIDSNLGHGSTFRIRLPLTLAILPALIVQSSQNYFAVPQDNLLEIIDLRDGQDKLNELGGAKVYSLRGNLLPLVGLADLTTGSTVTDFSNGYILVVQVNNSKFGLVVENILDTEEIVVKPLGEELKGLDIFSGVTIHGNGKIAWIVDAASIALRAQIDDTISNLDQGLDEDDYENMESMLRFEVRDVGSIAVDILSVIRVEQVTKKDIIQHSKRYVYRFNGVVIPVFTFGLESIDDETISLIIIEDDGNQIALLAHEIHDVCREVVNPSALLREDWSVGMSILDSVPTAIIAVDSILECVR